MFFTGILDPYDLDDDNDGIPDELDDSDGDGIPDSVGETSFSTDLNRKVQCLKKRKKM